MLEVVLVAEDVAERQKARVGRAGTERGARFRSLTMVLDSGGRIRYASPSVGMLPGRRLERLVGEDLFDYGRFEDLGVIGMSSPGNAAGPARTAMGGSIALTQGRHLPQVRGGCRAHE